jgi:hypothetical protein
MRLGSSAHVAAAVATAAAIALLAVFAVPRLLQSAANAQTPPPAGAGSEFLTVGYECGALLRSSTKVGSQGGNYVGNAWVNMPDARVRLSVTPGNTDCILVTFSAVGYAQDAAAAPVATCYIRPIAGGATMFPRGDFPFFNKFNDSIYEPRSMQWIYRITPTTSSIDVYLQYRAFDANDYCNYGAWVLTAQRLD